MQMKRLLTALLLVVASAMTACAFPVQTNFAAITIGDNLGNQFKQFTFRSAGFDDQAFNFNVSESLAGYSASFKVAQQTETGQVAFISLQPADITITGANVFFTLNKTNIPPNGSYQAELRAFTMTTNQARSIARGTWIITDSLYDDDDSTYPWPGVKTNLQDYLLKTEAATTYITTASAGDITDVTVSGGLLTGGATSGSADVGLTMAAVVSAVGGSFVTTGAWAAADSTTNYAGRVLFNAASNALRNAIGLVDTNSLARDAGISNTIGGLAATYLVHGSNLADVGSAATARTNLGLASAATANRGDAVFNASQVQGNTFDTNTVTVGQFYSGSGTGTVKAYPLSGDVTSTGTGNVQISSGVVGMPELSAATQVIISNAIPGSASGTWVKVAAPMQTVLGPITVYSNLNVSSAAVGGELAPSANASTALWTFVGSGYSNAGQFVVNDTLAGGFAASTALAITSPALYVVMFDVSGSSTSTVYVSGGGVRVTNSYAGSAGATFTNEFAFISSANVTVETPSASGQIAFDNLSVRRKLDGTIAAGARVVAPEGYFANQPQIRAGAISNDGPYVSGGGAFQSVSNSGGLLSVPASAYGAIQVGFISSGSASIGSNAFGAIQSISMGGTNQVASIGPLSLGARQAAILSGTPSASRSNSATIGNASYGADQEVALVSTNGSAGIGNNAYGAMQRGRLSNASATNDGIASIGIFDSTTQMTQTITAAGSASIGLGGVTVSNKNSIVAGDNNVSHGDASITAGTFWGDGSHLTGVAGSGTMTNVNAGGSNYPVSVSLALVGAGVSSTSASPTSVTWTLSGGGSGIGTQDLASVTARGTNTSLGIRGNLAVFTGTVTAASFSGSGAGLSGVLEKTAQAGATFTNLAAETEIRVYRGSEDPYESPLGSVTYVLLGTYGLYMPPDYAFSFGTNQLSVDPSDRRLIWNHYGLARTNELSAGTGTLTTNSIAAGGTGTLTFTNIGGVVYGDAPNGLTGVIFKASTLGAVTGRVLTVEASAGNETQSFDSATSNGTNSFRGIKVPVFVATNVPGFVGDGSSLTGIAYTNTTIGSFQFSNNWGTATFLDGVVDTNAAVGTEESYSTKIDGNIIAKIYAQSDGAGSIRSNQLFAPTINAPTNLAAFAVTINPITTMGVTWTNGVRRGTIYVTCAYTSVVAGAGIVWITNTVSHEWDQDGAGSIAVDGRAQLNLKVSPGDTILVVNGSSGAGAGASIISSHFTGE